MSLYLSYGRPWQTYLSPVGFSHKLQKLWVLGTHRFCDLHRVGT